MPRTKESGIERSIAELEAIAGDISLGFHPAPEVAEQNVNVILAVAADLRSLEAERDGLEGALRSTQDTLLHKVPRSQAVREQLAINREALLRLRPE